VPSITTTLIDLGLINHIVGRTKFCHHQHEQFQSISQIGGTKTLNINKIKSIAPDVIIANKEENTEAQIEELSTLFTVYVSDVHDLNTNFNFIKDLGNLTNTISAAKQIIQNTKQAFSKLPNLNQQSVAYFIWKDPFMVAANQTFIHSILKELHFKNVFAQDFNRYPAITESQLIQAAPNYILLSSEPYPFAPKHLQYFNELLPQSKVLWVDGVYFSWFGSKMQDAPAYFKKLFCI
jgi:ABC-type Fe3+-hydroxamate transport system substrate-binding protein